MAGRSYPIPNQTVPILSRKDHLEDLKEFIFLTESLGIKVSGTRISRYVSYYEALVQGYEEERLFQGISGTKFNNPGDLQLYVLREVHEMMWILKGLKKHLPKGIKEKLNQVVGGRDFAALDKDSSSRNTQFELRIASYFCQAGYSVDMSTPTDIVATHDGVTYFVECKRVTSSAALNKRLKEAKKQLRVKLARFTLVPRNFGIIAVDVTKVAFKHNGLTLGVTTDHSKDVIQDQLKKIDASIMESGFSLEQKNLLLTWLQIHIPAVVLNPPQDITRFSSLFVTNSKLRGRSIEALKKLNRVLTIGDIRDEREIPAKILNFRKGVTLPKGTLIGWDEELLGGMLDTWNLDPRQPEHKVLDIIIDNEKTEFSFFELSLLLANLSEEDRLKYSKDHMLARAELAARLILQRSPYEDDMGA
jgi:hypothetical protein